MSEISFGSILDGVSLALHAAFPPPVQIHGGDVEQGISPGDFNVVMAGGVHAQELGQRYKRTPVVDVLYYPHEGKSECYAVAEKLTAVLESIVTPEGDTVHASSCEWNITDGVLHMLVSYRHFAYRHVEEIAMGELKIEQKG